MSKVVFFGLFAHGHINPTIGVVKELIHRGEEVIYYSTSEFKSLIASMGAKFREYPFKTNDSGNEILGLDKSLVDIKIDDTESLNQLGGQIMSDMNIYFQVMNNPKRDLKKEIAAIKPDYIIHDSLAMWGKVMAKQLGIPAISSVTIFAYCDKMLETHPEFVIEKILKLPAQYLTDPVLTRKVIQRVSKLIGRLTNISDYDWVDKAYSQEMLNIVFTSKECQYFGEIFDSKFKFVGPSIYPRNDSHRFPFEKLTGAKMIYVSLGSMLIHEPSFLDYYKECFSAFRDLDKQIILSIGKFNPKKLGNIPDNFIIRDTVPQIDILKRASLVVTHGGMNTVNEALYFDVPLIVIPQRWDQFMVAERVNELGVGIYLKNQEYSVPALFQAINEIFQNPSYQRRSKIIGASLRDAGGYQQAVNEIFNFKQANGIK